MKGIDPRARARAKTAARREGMTLGEWLNRVILDESDPASARWDDALEAFPGFGESAATNEADDKLLRAMVNRLTERIESSEDMSVKALSGLDRALTQLADKIASSDSRLQTQLEDARGAIDRVRSGQDELNNRVKSLESSDGTTGSAESNKAVETTMMKLARRLYQHENDIAARLHDADLQARDQADTSRKANESLEHRVDRMENRAADFADLSKRRDARNTQALTELHRAADSLRARVEDTERVTGDAARTLETSFTRLDDRLRALENRNSSDYVELEQRFDRFSEEVAKIIADTRNQMAKALTGVAPEPRVDQLERALTEALQRIDASEQRHSDSMGRLGDEISRFAGAIDKRMTESEERAKNERSEEQLERRFEDVRKENKAAVRQMGEEVTRLGRSLAERIARSEERSAEAVETATERMASAVERLEESRSSREGDLEGRLRESEERTAKRIEDALTGVQDRMASVRAETEEALTPVQKAMAALADRLESIEQKRADAEEKAEETAKAAQDEAAKAEQPAPAVKRAPVDFSTPLAAPPKAEVPRAPSAPTETDPFLSPEPAPAAAPVLRAPAAPQPAPQPAPQAAPRQQQAAKKRPQARTVGATADADFLAAARERTRLSGYDFESETTAGSRRSRHLLMGSLAVALIALVGAGGLVIRDTFTLPSNEPTEVSGDFLTRVEADLAAGSTAPATPAEETAAPVETPAAQPVSEPEVATAEPVATPPSNVVADATGTIVPPAPAEAETQRSTQASPTPLTGSVTLESAAADGNPVARFQLGMRQLENGQLTGAVINLRRAAEQGVPAAQYRYAKMLETGEGVDLDLEAARQWTERAANAGHRRAMHNLGVMYYTGVGVGQDYDTAARWFQEAALLGLRDAQFNLALLFEAGQGLPLSLPDAYAWYTIAATDSDPTAAQRAADLIELMPPDALAEAQAMAAGFSPRPINAEANGLYTNQPWDRTATADSESVRRAQAFLSVLGYAPGTIDGLMGERTRQAIMAFENDHGLPLTGRVDSVLIERLERAAAG